MATIGIFTVKKLCYHQGHYYTYGGFGDYLSAMRQRFERVVLVAHVKELEPPQGHYVIPAGADLSVVWLPQVRTELGTWLWLPYVMWKAWVATEQMDVVHARMPNHTGLVGAWACKLRRKPLFIQVIADWHLQAQQMPARRKGGLGLLMKGHLYLYDWLERMTCRGQLVFAQGESCYAKHAQTANCDLVLSSSHRIHDIRLPTPKFTGANKRILNVARLTGIKNQALILRALAELRRTDPSWSLTLVGEGPLMGELRALAQQLGISEAVTLVGQVGRGESLWRFFDEADCFVLSSHSEGTPKVLLEAMARGLPVIATAVGGVPSTVAHEQRGLLFPSDDVQELVLALRRMDVEVDLRTRMAHQASEFARLHTVDGATDAMVKRVVSQWPQLAGSKR